MFAAALRTLGNPAEAEDVVQEAWLRWQNTDRERIRNAPAFLTTTTVRLAINHVTGARTRRELPMEIPSAELADLEVSPGLLAERGQALEAALALLLEKLSALERAAYLLREAFGYSYRQVARVVRLSEANSRQLVTRARRRVLEARRARISAHALQRILDAFSTATQTGELAGLEAVLRADIAAGN